MVSSNADNDHEFSGGADDEDFDEDMEALRRACILTGTDLNTLQPSPAPANETISASDSEDDDIELVRGIQRRLSACNHTETPLFLKPLSTLPPSVSEEDDDFELLRAIQNRFAGYGKDSQKNSTDNFTGEVEHVLAANIAVENEISNNLVVDLAQVSDVFPDSLHLNNTYQSSESITNIIPGINPSSLIEWHPPDNHCLAVMPCGNSGFPKSGQMFVDAIKKNRACQKFLRCKMMQIESKIEENKILKQRVKLLKDFQVSCKKRTGRALSQKKDASVQLISAMKPKVANSKVNVKNFSPLHYGPYENAHVASYKIILTKCPISWNREKWSHEERENLSKGIKQQFQELLLQKSVDLISDVEGSSGNPTEFDNMIASIRDLDITPENIRSFLPKVNWERLASMYVRGRSGAECEARWLNCEDFLINHNPWSRREDKELLHIIQERGISDWTFIAVSLGTNRTPFQCLARYQRSLNASILKRQWTEDDDDKLRAAVETFGESNWQLVASTLEGRTGTQCSNRWMKSLHPARQRVGRWTLYEDKRLKVAVMFFGPKNWTKIAEFVPGRTHVQCRERWFNILDPSLIFCGWTEEEDSKLDEAVPKHRNCWSKVYWSKVAACVPPRTDNQCKRRWKYLHPAEWSLLQAARKIQNAALISNFVDRESERPALGPYDFIPLELTSVVSENAKSRSKKPTKEAQCCLGEVPLLTDGNEIHNCGGGDHSVSMKRVTRRPRSKKKKKNFERQLGPCDWAAKRKRSFGRRKRIMFSFDHINKSTCNHVAEVEDGGDDMTLALFIENIRKKRRFKLAETMGNLVILHESLKDSLGDHQEADDDDDSSGPPPGFEYIRATT